MAKLRTVGKMVLTRSALCVLTVATALLAAGCQQVGPTAAIGAPKYPQYLALQQAEMASVLGRIKSLRCSRK